MPARTRRVLLALTGVVIFALGLTVVWLSAQSSRASDQTAEPRQFGDLVVSDLSASKSDADEVEDGEIQWMTDLPQALAKAKSEGKLVMIDFYATWCGPCQLMERTTFQDPKVIGRMHQFIAVKIDTDRQPAVAGGYGVTGLPTSLIVAADGQPVQSAIGYLDAEKYLRLIDAGSNDR
ncbi:MAG: thioredoxin fold domain-containing protein [Planctomycetes bacterium]|nr:thioredoxin fold domain-containing protein [Planctomycetota bacterium]